MDFCRAGFVLFWRAGAEPARSPPAVLLRLDWETPRRLLRQCYQIMRKLSSSTSEEAASISLSDFAGVSSETVPLQRFPTMMSREHASTTSATKARPRPDLTTLMAVLRGLAPNLFFFCTLSPLHPRLRLVQEHFKGLYFMPCESLP